MNWAKKGRPRRSYDNKNTDDDNDDYGDDDDDDNKSDINNNKINVNNNNNNNDDSNNNINTTTNDNNDVANAADAADKSISLLMHTIRPLSYLLCFSNNVIYPYPYFICNGTAIRFAQSSKTHIKIIGNDIN